MRMLTVEGVLHRFMREVGAEDLVGGPQDLADGLAQIQGELYSIAIEARKAETRGLSLAEACEDFESYPCMVRFHNGVEDILHLQLPPELVHWAEKFLATGETPLVKELADILVYEAHKDGDPVRRALWRFLLFEGIRFNSLVFRGLHPGELDAVGLEDADISRHAELEMRIYLETLDDLPSGVSPLKLMMSSAMIGVLDHAQRLASSLFQLKTEMLEMLQRRSILEKLLHRFDSRDRLLIRNYLAEHTGHQKLTVKRLQERHSLALGVVKHNTLDQRMKRLKERLGRDDRDLPQRGTSYLDLIQRELQRREQLDAGLKQEQ